MVESPAQFVADGSAADAILSAVATAQSRFAALSPAELTLNALTTAVVCLMAAGLSWLLARMADRLRRASDGEVSAAPWTMRLGQAAIVGCAALVSLKVWGVDIIASLAGAASGPVAATLLRLALTVGIAIAAWEGVSFLVERPLRRRAEREKSPRRRAQLRSIAPLVMSLARSVVAVIGGLLVIAQLGVDLGPLLAGAGFVSLAVAFGAQTILKDYMTGISLIMEDIAAVGDVVRIGDSSGLVETMTLRTIRLRDFDGTLHVIPYSEAQIIHNLTKTFSYYVFDLSISYGSDIDEALGIMRLVGEELRADVEFAESILAPIEVYGVDKLADSGVILKARIKTAPLKQWDVGREYNRRIKMAFDAAGIEIPFPHVKLVVDGRAPQAAE